MNIPYPRLTTPEILKKPDDVVSRQVYDEYDNWQLAVRFVSVRGVKTALYGSKVPGAKATLLFVHGIGGDHHGMVPLAYLLKDTYDILLVDLPGHGQSSMPDDNSLAFLEEWSREMLDTINEPVDMVISHSFGCYTAQFMRAPFACYINAPLALSPAVLDYSFKLYSVRHLASLVYNVRPYALWRGRQLVYDLTDVVKARIAWVTDTSRISRSQFIFQAAQGRQTTDGRALMRRELIDRAGSSFVLSQHDKIAAIAPGQRRWIKKLPILELSDDHLSVLESPEMIADMITRQVKGEVTEV